MRKFIIKHFVGDYYFKIFGRSFNHVRAAVIIFPLMLLMALLLDDWDYPYVGTLDDILILALVGIAMSISFVYLRFYPAKWREMDTYQKWQYGFHHNKLSPRQSRTWININKKICNKLDNSKFYNLGIFLINPVATIITIIIYLL